MAGLQTNIYVAAIVTWVAAFVALILRVIARRMTKQRWWVDDYFCVSAFVSHYVHLLLDHGLYLQTGGAATWSLGQTLDPSLTEEQREDALMHARRLMFCCEFCYAFSIASTKFTILTLYWRLFYLSSIRIPIQIIVCLASVITIVESIRYNPETTEMPHDVAMSFIWGNVEMNVAIVSGN
ncbi:hypothetical protein G7Z17_g3579 [Cylindrodendrum hubeiense]|uniref:Rhodopsin domain-containing protein n=1 Tax=Cylindrodendrum hubeiense TaxID=595255 RepID=A0A9P5LDE0_9HYPO|nr:hypothetical protein G7Z17_g3579 [Cylindrodendrum hubeiense]